MGLIEQLLLIFKNTKEPLIFRKEADSVTGIIEIDVHGKNVETTIRDGIRDEFSYGREPKVKRITMGDNQGITELILREF